MTRMLRVAAAQLGPITRVDAKASVVKRLIALMREAKALGAQVVAYPELALTSFFPRWYFEDQAQIDQYFETDMPSAETQPLFDEAKRLSIGFHLGYAELVEIEGRKRRFNTAILVNQHAEIVHRYRKIHLPGHEQHEPWRAFQHLEKRYFEVGNLGFGVTQAYGGFMGVCICNDRRWPESYRIMGLQGVEMIFIGYNTPVHNPPAPEHDALSNFHNRLVMQAGAYQNACWVVGVAKAGVEEGVMQIGQSQIIAPSVEVVAQCSTLGDELCVAVCDLDLCFSYKRTTFNFEKHRQPEHYSLIVERRGAQTP